MGGHRNWDYRFTWVRDGSLSVFALLGLGFTEEAPISVSGYASGGRAGGEESGPLKIMYRVDGRSDLVEETLDHFERLHGPGPYARQRRFRQLQLDIYGEALNSIYALDSGAVGDWGVGHVGWTHIVRMIDWLCEHWQDPDEGIWETLAAGGPSLRPAHVLGRFDRAIRMATNRGRPADLARGTRERDLIHEQIMTKGWNESLGACVQYEGGDVLDASLVLMPLDGIRRRRTTPGGSRHRGHRRQTLVSDSLVYRYDPGAA